MYFIAAHFYPLRWLAKRVFWDWEWIPLGRWEPSVLGLTIGRKPSLCAGCPQCEKRGADAPGASTDSPESEAPSPRA